MDPMDESVTITLNRAEAIVLFEMVSGQGRQQEIKIRDKAERGTLWSIECALERELTEPLQDDYLLKLEDARRRVTARHFGDDAQG
jgi:hypothetical protein